MIDGQLGGQAMTLPRPGNHPWLRPRSGRVSTDHGTQAQLQPGRSRDSHEEKGERLLSEKRIAIPVSVIAQ